MVLSIVIMLSIIGFSRVFDKGLLQLQEQKKLEWVTKNIDLWSSDIIRQGFSSSDMSLGEHYKDIDFLPSQTYQLYWHVEQQAPRLKNIQFRFRQSSPESELIHEWTTSVSYP